MSVEVVLVVVAVVAGMSTLLMFNRRTPQHVQRWPTGLVAVPKAVWLMWLVAGVFVLGWVSIKGH